MKSKVEAERAALDIFTRLRDDVIEPRKFRLKRASKDKINEYVLNPDFLSDARLSGNASEHDNGIGGAYLLTDRSEPLRTGRFVNRRRKGIEA